MAELASARQHQESPAGHHRGDDDELNINPPPASYPRFDLAPLGNASGSAHLGVEMVATLYGLDVSAEDDDRGGALVFEVAGGSRVSPRGRTDVFATRTSLKKNGG